MGIKDKQNAATHAIAACLANAQDNTIPAILESNTPSCNINSDPDLDCGYEGGLIVTGQIVTPSMMRIILTQI